MHRIFLRILFKFFSNSFSISSDFSRKVLDFRRLFVYNILVTVYVFVYHTKDTILA